MKEPLGKKSNQDWTETLAEVVGKNRQLILAFVGVAVVGTLGYFGWTGWQSHKEEKAQLSLYKAQAQLTALFKVAAEDWRKAKTPPAPEKSKTDKKTETPSPSAPNPNFGDLVRSSNKEKLNGVVSSLTQVISDFPNSKASDSASLAAARILTEQGQIDDAISLLQKQIRDQKDGSLLSGLVQFQMAGLQMLKGDLAGATDRLSQIVQSTELKYLHAEALLRLGFIAEKQKDAKKARDLFERVVSEFGQSEAARAAKKNLRLLNMPNLESSPKS